MRYLVTGGCGFVGAALCRRLVEGTTGAEVVVLDNLRRRGSEMNRTALERLGVRVVHGDLRVRGDIEDLGRCDWVIDAAAEPSVLAGTGAIGGGTWRRQLVEHNMLGTAHLLEAAATWDAGVILLSTSRVYAIRPLAALPLVEEAGSNATNHRGAEHFGSTPLGVCRQASRQTALRNHSARASPVSLYGATKLAAEILAAEYSLAAGTPLVIDRCGVMAGAGQFGRADQGIFSWWIHSWVARRKLSFIGFGGRGLQVRDCLHPLDLGDFLLRQMATVRGGEPELLNVSGGVASAMSLAQLSAWCEDRFGPLAIGSSAEGRPYDLAWVVLDHGEATRRYGWKPQHSSEMILSEIAEHAERHPDWLAICGG